MKYIFFCFLFVIMSCKSGKDIGNSSVAIGTARNDKAGAVLNSNGEVYLISGLHNWDSIYLGKTVKVKGCFDLRVGEDEVYIKNNDTKRLEKFQAQMYHRYYLVTDATWELYNSN